MPCAQLTIPEWFLRELRIFDQNLRCRWNRAAERFEILQRLSQPRPERQLLWWESKEIDPRWWENVLTIETPSGDFRYPRREDLVTLKNKWYGRFPQDGQETQRGLRAMDERNQRTAQESLHVHRAQEEDKGARIWDVVHGKVSVGVPSLSENMNAAQ